MKQPYNKFINIFYFYIFVYIIFFIFGYSSLSNLINNKTIQIINFNENTPNYVVKRFVKLSLVALLFSAITFLTINVNLYIISLILHIVVILGYRLYLFDENDVLTYIIHIIMAIPIFLLPFYTFFSGSIDYYYILLLIIFLLIYKLYLFDYIYIHTLSGFP